MPTIKKGGGTTVSNTPKKKHMMDKKLLAYTQPYEVKQICSLWKKETDDKKHVNIRVAEFKALVSKWEAYLNSEKGIPHKHSLKSIEALLIGAGYTKYPRKKKKKLNIPDTSFGVPSIQ